MHLLPHAFTPHAFTATYIYCHIHLLPHTFTATYIYCHIHLLPHTFTATYIYCHIHLLPHTFTATYIYCHRSACYQLIAANGFRQRAEERRVSQIASGAGGTTERRLSLLRSPGRRESVEPGEQGSQLLHEGVDEELQKYLSLFSKMKVRLPSGLKFWNPSL